MNWGGFAGGFASGFAGGVKMGGTINDLLKQDKIEKVRKQGISEANAARAASVDSSIKETPSNPAAGGLPGTKVQSDTTTPSNPAGLQPSGAVTAPVQTSEAVATPLPAPGEGAKAIASEAPKQITPHTAEPASAMPAQPGSTAAPAAGQPAASGLPFTVGGKGYATREEARAAAEKQAPGVMEFMSKTLVPRMQQAYIEQGNIEMADAWGKWAEEKDNKAAMKEWANAYRAAQMGNIEKAADHVFNLYKRYDDGITPMSKEVVKDKAGNITGFNVRLKTDSSGEERTQFIGKRELTEMGLSALAPPQMFEAQFKRQQEADKTAAQFAGQEAKDNRTFVREVTKEKMKEDRADARDKSKQQHEIEKMTIEKQLDAANASTKVKREVGAKVEALRSAGYSDDFINGVLPEIVGVGSYKRATSPDEARRLAHSDRMKSDPMYSRKSAADQQKILDQDMKLIYGGVKPSNAPAAAAPATPAAGGLPATAQPKKGVPVYDTKTGQIVYR